MIELEEFDRIVSSNFSYLLGLGFTKGQVERGYAMYYVRYLKDDLLVSIEYSTKNDYVNVEIIKNLPGREKNRGNHKNSVLLFHLMSKYQPNFDYTRDYEKLMPKAIGIRKSVKAIAQLFGQYAIEILLGKKFESWGDITGYKSPKSAELNVFYKGKRIGTSLGRSNQTTQYRIVYVVVNTSDLSGHFHLKIKEYFF